MIHRGSSIAIKLLSEANDPAPRDVRSSSVACELDRERYLLGGTGESFKLTSACGTMYSCSVR